MFAQLAVTFEVLAVARGVEETVTIHPRDMGIHAVAIDYRDRTDRRRDPPSHSVIFVETLGGSPPCVDKHGKDVLLRRQRLLKEPARV